MSEIQAVADSHSVQYLLMGIGGLVSLVNVLGFYILHGIKQSIEDLWSKINKDHDILIALKAAHDIKNRHE